MRTTPRAAARNAQFRSAVAALVERLGGHRSGSPLYEFTLDTPLGELALSPVDSDIGPWLACRFRDVARARLLRDDRLNPYSGKWNHMHDDIAAIEQALVRVLTFEVLATQVDGPREAAAANRLAA